MAWLQTDPTSGNQHICFRFGGKKFRRSLGISNGKKARRKLARLEDTIELVQSGRIELPGNVDIPTFLLSDGKLNVKHAVEELRICDLFDEFFDSIPNGSLEPRTIAQMKSHRVHLEEFFGKRFLLAKLSFNELQSYVAKRSKGKGIRGRTTNSNTSKKEIVTLRGLWKWCVSYSLPNRREPKSPTHFAQSIFLSLNANNRRCEIACIVACPLDCLLECDDGFGLY